MSDTRDTETNGTAKAIAGHGADGNLPFLGCAPSLILEA